MTDAEKDIVERLSASRFLDGESWIEFEARRALDQTDAMSTITTLRAEVERLTEERETIFMDIVDERDAAIARAEKAEAALAKVDEIAWLIEWPSDKHTFHPRFWHPQDGWVWDAAKAIRFCRKVDAEDFLKSQRGVRGWITEHVFVASLTEGE